VKADAWALSSLDNGGYFTQILDVGPVAADSAITVAHGWQCVQTREVFASQVPPDIDTGILTHTHKCESLRRASIDAKKATVTP
jgi:hypothetical protein